jgi:hypothetical protein
MRCSLAANGGHRRFDPFIFQTMVRGHDGACLCKQGALHHGGEAPSEPRARKENEKTPLALLRNNLRQLETGVLDHFDVLFVALTAGGQVTLREH